MGKLRTSAQLEAIFQQIRERKQREKEALQRKQQKQQKKVQKKQEEVDIKLEKYIYQQQRTIHVNRLRYVERFADDHNFYTTREELKQAEERNEGKINWTFWDKLTAETKQQLK